MLRATPRKREAKSPLPNRTIRYPSIGADAKKLGVHRVHLWQVLTGRRQSKSLLRRYHTLKRGQ